MPTGDRYSVLVEQHRKVEAEIAAELKRPLPNDFALQRLKRRKLLLKDKLESWQRLLSALRVPPERPSGALHP